MKITNPNCKCCLHPDRDEIDEMIINKVVARKIVAKFPDISQANISNHRKHVALSEFCEVPEKLKELLNSALMSDLKPESIADVVRLLDWIERNENKDFLQGKERWDDTFDEKINSFEHIIMNTPFFNAISKPLRRGIIVTAKDIFSQEPPRDTGKWIGDMFEALKELPDDDDTGKNGDRQ